MKPPGDLARIILEGDTVQDRLAACKEAGDRNLKELIPILAFILREKDALFRTASLRALGNIHHLKARQHISRLLTDKDEQVRAAAAAALLNHGTEALPTLLNLLKRGGRLGKVSAASCLAALKDKRAIIPIIEQLGHCDRSTVIVMSQTLSEFGEKELATLFPGLYLKESESMEMAQKLLKAGDFRFITPMIRYLKMCRHSPYHYEIHEVLKSLESTASDIGKSMYCMMHFHRFTKRKFFSNFYPFQYSPYVACRLCRSSSYGKKIETVVANLSHTSSDVQWRNNNTLRINWFKREELFDFDRVEINDASEQEIMQFCLKIGNDTDRFRRKRYKQMLCLVLDKNKVDENSRRVLSRTFGKVHIG